MVILDFKMNELGKVELDIQAPTPLSTLLARVDGAPRRGLIPICEGRVIGLDDPVSDGSVVELFPALAGG